MKDVQQDAASSWRRTYHAGGGEKSEDEKEANGDRVFGLLEDVLYAYRQSG